MDKLQINGGIALEGEVRISGAKNATLPIVAAALLADGPVTIRNVPHLQDVTTMIELLGRMGVSVTIDEKMRIEIDPTTTRECFAPYDLVKTMRASVLVLGSAARPGGARPGVAARRLRHRRPAHQPPPARPCTKLGAEIEVEHGYVEARAERLRGADDRFDTVTVTGTENVMMAARSPRARPCIRQRRLRARGRRPRRPSRSRWAHGSRARAAPRSRIQGVEPLRGRPSYAVIPDRIETGTYLAACAIAGGDGRDPALRPRPPGAVHREAARDRGRAHRGGTGQPARARTAPARLDVRTLPYPGFPTDMQAQYMALHDAGPGDGHHHRDHLREPLHARRASCERMGADIRVDGRTAVIKGAATLSGAQVMATDLRASACLVLAGLAAAARPWSTASTTSTGATTGSTRSSTSWARVSAAWPDLGPPRRRVSVLP